MALAQRRGDDRDFDVQSDYSSSGFSEIYYPGIPRPSSAGVSRHLASSGAGQPPLQPIPSSFPLPAPGQTPFGTQWLQPDTSGSLSSQVGNVGITQTSVPQMGSYPLAAQHMDRPRDISPPRAGPPQMPPPSFDLQAGLQPQQQMPQQLSRPPFPPNMPGLEKQMLAPPTNQVMNWNGNQFGAIKHTKGRGQSSEEQERIVVMGAFAYLGTGLLAILCLLPAWNAIELLYDNVYLYFAGRGFPWSLVIFVTYLLLIIMAQYAVRIRLRDMHMPDLPDLHIPGLPSCLEFFGCPSCPEVLNPCRALGLFLTGMTAESCLVISVAVVLIIVWRVWQWSLSPDMFYSFVPNWMPSLADFQIPGLPKLGDLAKFLPSIPGLLSWLIMLIPNTISWFFALAGTPPMAILVTCVMSVFLYQTIVRSMFRIAAPETHKASNLMMIWTFHMLIIGIMFCVLSLPLTYTGKSSYFELFNTCETGSRTQSLFVTSQALQALRQTPACAQAVSIEECVGFVRSPYTDVLKNMEMDLRCSGLCYNPASLPVLATAGSTDSDTAATSSAASLATTASPDLSMMQHSHEISRKRFIESDASASPPTLFSQANYEASCDGMAARSMQNFVGGTGRYIFKEGVMLVSIAICVALGRLFGLCSGMGSALGLEARGPSKAEGSSNEYYGSM